MKTTPIIHSLVGGVLSPRAAGRADIQQYFQSAEDLLNCLVECYGGAKNRAGWLYRAPCKYADKDVRDIPFNFNDTQAYNIEMGDGYMRFYRLKAQIVVSSVAAYVASTTYAVGALVVSGGINYYCIKAGTNKTPATETTYWYPLTGSIYEIPTPYTEAQIWDVTIKSSGDIAYLFHPDHPVYKLSRTGHTSWTLVAVDFSTGTNRAPLMDENVSSTTITPSAATGTGITLTASVALFDEKHIGSIWKVNTGYVKIATVASGGLKTTCTADVLYGGTLTGTSAYTVWAEAAWSGYRGYPRAGTFDEQRLMAAGTRSQPQTVWGSKVREFENFELGEDDADGLDYTIATDTGESIKWLFPADQMAVGTSGGVHSLGSGSALTPLTPTNVVVKKQTTYGCRGAEPVNAGHPIPPVGIGSYVYYVQKYGRKLREYVYNLNVDKFEAGDATVLAEHVTETGIVDMAYQQDPDNNLWMVLENGKMAVFTRQVEQKVSAFTPIETDGEFKSVSVIPGDGEDEVWAIVRRKINGSYVRYQELLSSRTFEEQEDWCFMDSAISLDNPITITGATAADPVVITAASHGLSDGDIVKIRGVVGMTEINGKKYKVANNDTNTFELTTLDGSDVDGSAFTAYESGGEVRKCVTTISGLSHLEGEEVVILADGGVHAKRTVVSGSITLDDYYSQVNVGLAYTARILTNDLESGGNQGTSQGKMRRIASLVIRFFESVGCKFGTVLKQDTLTFRTSAMNTDQAPAAFTGDKGPVAFPSGYSRKKQILITQEQPLPLHVLAIIPVMETND